MPKDIDIEETNFRAVPKVDEELLEALDTFAQGTNELSPAELTHNLRVMASALAGIGWRVNAVIGSGVSRKIKVKN